MEIKLEQTKKLLFVIWVSKKKIILITIKQLIQNFSAGAQALWRRVQVHVNGNDLSTFAQADNAYKAYVETIISYTESAARTHLKLSHFEMDTAGKFDDFTEYLPSQHYKGGANAVAGRESNADEVNMGWNKRRTLIASSKSLQFEIPFHSDFFAAERYMPPGFSFSINLQRKEPDDFALMYPPKRIRVLLETNTKLFLKNFICEYSR